MNDKLSNAVDFHQWNRNILNSYWFVIVVVSVTELILVLMYAGKDGNLLKHLFDLVFVPSVIMMFALTCAEAGVRFGFRGKHYLIILASNVFSVVVVERFHDINGIQMAFLISLFSSLSYYDKRKILFAFAVNLMSLLVLYEFDAGLHAMIGPYELVVTLAFFLVTLKTLFSIMKRGIQLHQNLIQTMNHQQELLIQNVIMDKLTKMDALTGLYNHKTFHEYLDRMVEQAEKGRISIHLAILDIDNFKKINDTYGHWAGDLILKRVSQTISENVTPDDFTARYGGEEFAIIFVDKSTEVSHRIAEEIRLAISHIRHEELDGNNVTVSIGMQPYLPGKGKEQLFKGADRCLYQSKHTGKNKTMLSEMKAI